MESTKQVSLVYGRASSDPKDQRISVDRQIKLCTARAHQLWPDAEVRVFRDDAITAAKPNVYRPGFAKFLAAVRSARKGEIAGIVVNEQSRLTRQGDGAWDELVVTLTKAGIASVETLRAGAVSVAPGNRLVGRLLAVVDAEEVERTKARVQAAHRDLFTEGRPWGRPPFGYRRIEGKDGRPAWVEDPVEAAAVRQAFAMALAGCAIAVIVDKLNDGPVPPRAARWKFKDGRQVTQWRPGTVRTLLSAPSVAGLRAHTDADGQLHLVPARWPALIDVDQWKQVQRMLGQPAVVTGTNGTTYRVRTKPKPQPRKYLLSGGRKRSGVTGQPGEVYGVLRCGKCDAPMVAQTQGRPNGIRIPAYACHPKSGAKQACGGVSISPADELEALVVDAIKAGLAKSPKLRRLLEASQDREVAHWRAERDAARARTLAAAEMFGTGTIDRPAFEAMHAPAKAALDVAEAKLSSMSTDTSLPSVDEVRDGWELLTLKQQRAVVERLIERIVIFPGNAGGSGFAASRVGEPEWTA
jgi:DNA invertase Pin-like site-specific DNA recombinase